MRSKETVSKIPVQGTDSSPAGRQRKTTRRIIGRNATEGAVTEGPGEPSHSESQRREKRFVWDERKRMVAYLIAEDECPDREICATHKLGTATLHAWKSRPEFQAEVDRIQRQIWGRMMRQSYSQQEVRINRLHLILEKIKEVRYYRTKAALDGTAPGVGMETGIMRRVQKRGSVDIVFDAEMIKAEREILKQIAIECGEWNEKKSADDFSDAEVAEFLANYVRVS